MAGFLSGALSSIAGAAMNAAGAASKLTYDSLKTKYKGFTVPQAAVFFGEKAFDNKGDYVIDDIEIELTCDFAASIARFNIYNVYDQETNSFVYNNIKNQVCIGNSLDIVLGYLGVGETVFHGFVAGIDFNFDADSMPYIEVTGMDIKGAMMASCYAQQIAASSYSAAVEQIFDRSIYTSLMKNMQRKIIATPDGGGMTGILGGATLGSVTSSSKSTASTIEMSSESDYEFVVKAAKKFNYEFFTDKNTIYFRPAKSETAPQAELAAGAGVLEFHVGYSVTGLVGEIEARSVDAGTGKLVKSSKKLGQDMAIESKAKALVKSSQKVYIDSTIQSQQDADARAQSLYEKMSYRLGSFEAKCIGIPDLSVGRFIDIKGMGSPADNSFYITTLTHKFSSENGYITRLEGKTARFGASTAGALGSAFSQGVGGFL